VPLVAARVATDQGDRVVVKQQGTQSQP
jgi:hypothetical protein